MPMFWTRLFAAGGIVMYPLLVFSVAAIAMIAERVYFWSKVKRRQPRLIREVLRLCQAQQVPIAVEKLQRHLDLPLARIFLAVLTLDQPTLTQVQLTLQTESQAELPVLRRFNSAFDTIVGLSPLLGLLGTVIGLITAFASLTLGAIGGEQTTAVTTGISEALVSTAAGLIVALITLGFANTFRGFYARQVAFMRECSGRLELLFERPPSSLTPEVAAYATHSR